MSRLGEAVLKTIIRSGAKEKRPPLLEGGHAGYFKWQFESTPKLLRHFPGLQFAGKRVLEIGCGTGGRTAYMASQGAAEAVGIDINAEEIALAPQLCRELRPELASKVRYLVSQENGILDIGQFDIVIMIDTMEHVVSPPAIVRLVYQYAKPGGSFYFSTIGWYHHSATHLRIFPWVQVFFSDETIINVVRWQLSRPDYVPTRFDSDPPVERWRGLYDLRDRPGEHLNKITISEIKKLMRYSIFEESELTVVGFGSPAVRWANFLTRVPVVQELFHSMLVVKMTKRPSGAGGK